MITIKDYTEAEYQVRKGQRVWVVVEEETREVLTSPMTAAEAGEWIARMARDERPNAVQGWMYIKEVDVEVFSDEEEELFEALDAAHLEVEASKLSLGMRPGNTPTWRVEQLQESLTGAKRRHAELVDRVFEAGSAQGFLTWRKQRQA